MKIHLNKLELHGFKSFPEKTVIKFHPGITVVVGPNGCGKSNIVDALLWVLGEQRIKNLRGENNEDLIFSGSSSKKPLGMTEVGVTFTNSKDDVYIARKFFRSGESRYILNEKYCRNKDIQDELYNLNLGGRNYFIFEQGSIEKLVSLKPSERRMLIEEAAGISQYLLRKKDTAGKLIVAEQNLDSLQILSADKESRLRELKNQANYAGRYRSIKTEHVEFTKAYLFKKYTAVNTEFKKRKFELEKFLNSEMVLSKELSSLEKKLSENETRKWQLDRELKEGQKSLYELNQNIMSQNSEVEKLRQRENFLEQKIIENEGSITNGSRVIKNKSAKIAELESGVNAIKNDYDSSLNDYNSKKSEIEKIRADNSELSGGKESLTSDLFSVRSRIAALNNEMHENEKLTVKLENEISSKTNYIGELRENIHSGKIKEIENKFRKAEKAFSDSGKVLDSLKIEIERSAEKIFRLESEAGKLNAEIHGSKKQRDHYLSMKEKLSGSLSTSKKKLQDMLSSGKEYHGLIENFYFDEIDSYMMENPEDINDPALERIILDSAKPGSIPAGVKKEAGYIDRVKNLFDLEKPGLKDFLKDGIVVSGLENAISIFRKYGKPVVTPAGEIITADGILIRKRGSGILNVVDEIRNIDLSISAAEKTLKKASEEQLKEREIKKDLDEKYSKSALEVKELEHETIRIRSELDNIARTDENNRKRALIIESEMERHQSEIQRFNKLLEEKSKEKAGLEKKLDELVKKRELHEKNEEDLVHSLNLKEKEFLSIENRVNLFREKLGAAETELKRIRSESDELKRDTVKRESENNELRSEIEKIKIRIGDLRKEGQSNTETRNSSEKLIKGNELTLDELNNKLKEGNEIISGKRAELEKIREMKSHEEIELAALKKDIFSLEEISFRELNMELKEIDPDSGLLETTLEKLEENMTLSNERMIRMRDSNRLNFSAESEYELLAKDYEVLLSQKADVIDSISDMNHAIKKIDDESEESFKASFEEIRTNFKRNFQILFEGGEADLALTDTENIFDTGLEIMAQPPGKRLQGLRLLSGGEKTLTSLAFLFALFEYKPSPFCVFDEVDASLDEANIQRFLKFLHKLKEKTQFLIITHNFKTMEEADYIYGISMNEPGISTIYSMKMN